MKFRGALLTILGLVACAAPLSAHAGVGYSYVSQFSAGSTLQLGIATSSNLFAVDGTQSKITAYGPAGGSELFHFGSDGSADGQFIQASGMAFDSSGNIYVTDNGNNRVQRFTSTGTFISKFGTGGTGNGQFSGPYGIATATSTGNIYVSDTNNNRVEVFSSTTAYVSQFGTSGTGNSQFNTPLGLAVDFAGNIYVADSNNNRVQVFSSSTAYLGQFGTSGSGDGQFNNPEEIYIDPNTGNIYVADTYNNRIEVFDSSWRYIAKVDNNTPGLGFFYATAVAVSTTSIVYVGDFQNNRIEIFRIVLPVAIEAGSISSPGATSVTLNASSTVDTFASSTDQGFFYGTTAGYGGTASTTGTFGSGTFSQTLSNLLCNTTYHYRPFVINLAGTASTSDQTFTTALCPPQPSSSSGGSVSIEELAKLLTPSAATTAYLKSRGINPTPVAVSGAIAIKVPSPATPTAPIATTSVSTASNFTLDLSFNMTNAEVVLLQKFLNAHGFPIALAGPGSIGHETDIFGFRTLEALKKFQAAHGLPSTGNFGPVTRAFVNGK